MLRRMGFAFPVAVVAAIVVAVVAVAAYLVAPGKGSEAADAPFMAVQNSNTLTLLEAKRQQLIDMNAASHTLTVAAKPKVVSPSQVMASSSPGASASASTGTGTGNSTPTAPIPSAGTAKSIGYNMLPSFGFSQSTQWGCLDDLWMHESSWVVDAQNASGAYGIPQALPASKMASAGSDYLTNPATQIKWGLGYIKSTYGSPCAAWNFELAHNYY